MGDSNNQEIFELLAEFSEKVESGEISLEEVAADNPEVTLLTRPPHLAHRTENPPNPDGVDPQTHVYLEWDEFIEQDPEFRYYHSIEDGCGVEHVTPCALTTEKRAKSAWFLAEPCPFCFGDGVRHTA